MELTDIIALAVVWVVAFAWGWVACERHAEKQLNHILEKTAGGVRVRERVGQKKKDFVQVEIEKHNDHYYVYNMKDKTFMAQGDTQKSLEETLTSKYPGKKFAAKEENLVEMGFINANDSK